MRVATIDIGTNSVLLLVAQRHDSEIEIVAQRAEITRLGAGVDMRGELSPEAIARTLAVLQDYAGQLQELGVQRRAAVGTSALRDARNATAFVQPATELLGCPVEVVSGPREAALVRRGVGSIYADLAAQDVIFDVGGGSTEFVRCENPPQLVSLNIGTVRLTERHIGGDPPAVEELEAVRQSVRGQLAALSSFFPRRINRLIGVAGTVTTLVTLELALDDYDSARVNGSHLDRTQVATLERRLATAPLGVRRTMAGLHPKRADVIVAGAVLVAAIMDHLGMTTLHVSDRGVRWGLIYELLDSGSSRA